MCVLQLPAGPTSSTAIEIRARDCFAHSCREPHTFILLACQLREAETALAELRGQTAARMAGAERVEAQAVARYAEYAADLAALRAQLDAKESAALKLEAQLSAATAEAEAGAAKCAALAGKLD
eukprot:SAG22_NODE_6214_length_884_cov_6.200000_1_plen_123_part_10